MGYILIIEYDLTEYPGTEQYDVEWGFDDEDEARDRVAQLMAEDGPDLTNYTVAEVRGRRR